ncbi:esterase [Parapedobacter defluvii]|uniref:Esterase n=1 Tax=Parapedobacter defluvii TaxID=2045106 RepID=A0ABQ1M8Z9_9SPHI|nr:hotdog fold thioesterase [Parapedobacter defluvii]RQP12898.1 MAG: hotdog fold thioesterase [Parapedobacter sp.]GGC35355.1 esterase [Parapedobacter defluvii]
MIWRTPINLDELNNAPEYMGTFLGIKFTEWDENSLTATMPVNRKTHQPQGILHGGASVVLAETIGSYASALIIDREKYAAVGLEVNANHLRPVSDGEIKGICEPIHIGRRTHVWNIKIVNKDDKLVCISRLTVAIIDHP